MPLVANPPGSGFQDAADKFSAALSIPDRLLKLAPKSPGNPGNAAALSPAVVLTTISAFEGFAEDLLALVLHARGQGLAHIAKQVGKLNNPTLGELAKWVSPHLSQPARQAIDGGPAQPIRVYRVNKNKNWTQAGLAWQDILDAAEAWMQARHLLTHGLVRGWRAETWPPPLKGGAPPASNVLQPKDHGTHSLDRTAAKSCARIYSLGARHIADTAVGDLGSSLSWSDFPSFD